MPYETECPSCQSRFQVKEEHAGKRGKCPRCRSVFVLPSPPPPVSDDPFDGELVPIDDPPPSSSPTPLQTSKRTATVDDDAEEAAGYVLAGGSAKRVKNVKVRDRAAPTMGAGAKGVAEAAAATKRTLTPAQILAAFQGEIEPVKPTPLYRLWVLVVACVMILLPLVYLAIVGGVIAGVVYHAVHNISIFQNMGHGRTNAKGAIFLYVGPLLAGGVVVAFMLKPLFARWGEGGNNRVLDPQVEPLLYAFVDGVCAAVHAPRPVRIEVDCQVNASARRDGGILGAVFREDLVLTIGLPLASGMTLRQFAGVLAHEFGHFSQGAGMRLYVVIMTINMWFAQVVYERDAWDRHLADASTSGNGYLMAIAGFARLSVWLTRRILWVLMQLGRIVSGFLSREMEFDADRYQARMVGARIFAQTMWRLCEMSLAQNGATIDLSKSWQEKRLPENFPKLLIANIPQIPQEVVAAYRKAAGAAKTGLFDTHPCDRDRINQAKVEEPGEGIFHLDGAATDLFRNFDSLAKAVTFEMYKAMLGSEITKDQLIAVADVVQTQAIAQEGYEAADRFFLNALSPTQPLPLAWDYPKAPVKPAEAKAALVAARRELEATRDDNLDAIKRSNAVMTHLFNAESAIVLLKAGVKIKAVDFGLSAATLKAAEAARAEADDQRQVLDATLGRFSDAASRRLTQALSILQADAVADRVPEGRDRREEARILYPCVVHLGGNVAKQLPELIRARQVLGGVIQVWQQEKNINNQVYINAVLRASADLHRLLEDFRWKVGDTIYYPFEHANDEVTLAQFALPAILPDKHDPGNLMNVTDGTLERLFGLYRRALGRLAVTAEEVEHALGLPPIEVEPVEEVA